MKKNNAACCSLFLIAISLALSACIKVQGVDLGKVYNVVTNVDDLGEKSQEEEKEIGAATAEAVLQQAPLVNDLALQQYVNNIGYWLQRQDKLAQDIPWRFAVIENSAVNAFAAPDGYVFVTTGMLAIIDSEAQLAGVLAHEMSHVMEKHYLNALQKKAQSSVLSDLTSIISSASNDDDSGSSISFGGGADSVGVELYSRGLDRDDEYAADQRGLLMAARSGYDVYAFASLLQVLASREESKEGLTFLQIHPHIEDRLTHLEVPLDYIFQQQTSMQTNTQRYDYKVRY